MLLLFDAFLALGASTSPFDPLSDFSVFQNAEFYQRGARDLNINHCDQDGMINSNFVSHSNL